MTATTTSRTSAATGWRAVLEEARRRIADRTWAPGAQIPFEEALATEFGCARATVNRAMRALAEEGLVERKRKGGTRVVEAPKRQARAVIPLIKDEIEATEAVANYALIGARHGDAPDEVEARFGEAGAPKLMHVAALHLADETPYVLEERWINLDVVPKAARAEFESVSANEWLVRNAPFTDGEIAMSAEKAGEAEAAALGVAVGASLLVVERLTRAEERIVTIARLTYAPGYKARLTI